MLSKHFFYAFHRTRELGLRGLVDAFKRRARTKIWQSLMRSKALAGTAHHSWPTIVRQNKIEFEAFLSGAHQDSYIETILKNQQFQASLPLTYAYPKKLLPKAHNAAHHVFNLLGSGPVTLGKTINWHHDFKKDHLRKPFTHVDPTFSYATYANAFHTDIPVPQRGSDFTTYHEDIKVLWDLGRMHHLSLLGLTYSHIEDKRFANVFKDDITSFQQQVKYLLGPQWKCPMDVAIRAINLVWSFHFFKDAILDTPFWEKYACMLYDHMIYLTWNMEESDKPNNHLLADHVGMLYLAVFFRSLPGGQKRLANAIPALKKAFLHQILPDGAAYEGSTAYHRLDCELLLHATSLLKAIDQPHDSLTNLLEKMLSFTAAATDNNGTLVKIGDDDSGTIVFGLSTPPAADGCKIFPDFGLGIVRTPRYHLTLRAASVTAMRPTGHYHHDALGITLSIDKHQIFVDPGSFVYSANAQWRHYFKAPLQHSTFFEEEYSQTSSDLFQTFLPYKPGSLHAQAGQLATMATMRNDQLKAQRSVTYNNTLISIHDYIDAQNSTNAITWRFVLHPEVQAQKTDHGYSFFVNAQCVATLTSSLHLNLKENATYAAAYGHFLPTHVLESTAHGTHAKTYITEIFLP
jgi:hypothetical protein